MLSQFISISSKALALLLYGIQKKDGMTFCHTIHLVYIRKLSNPFNVAEILSMR